MCPSIKSNKLFLQNVAGVSQWMRSRARVSALDSRRAHSSRRIESVFGTTTSTQCNMDGASGCVLHTLDAKRIDHIMQLLVLTHHITTLICAE